MATILMIEHDYDMFQCLEGVLGLHGHAVLYAPTAGEGIKLAEGPQLFDLVLLDIDLPDLNGKVVASTLRTRPALRKVPIVGVTARDDATTRRLVMAFGCSAVIPRPVDGWQMFEQIAAYLS